MARTLYEHGTLLAVLRTSHTTGIQYIQSCSIAQKSRFISFSTSLQHDSRLYKHGKSKGIDTKPATPYTDSDSTEPLKRFNFVRRKRRPRTIPEQSREQDSVNTKPERSGTTSYVTQRLRLDTEDRTLLVDLPKISSNSLREQLHEHSFKPNDAGELVRKRNSGKTDDKAFQVTNRSSMSSSKVVGQPLQKREPWQIQKQALKQKFGHEGWQPRKKLSPDAMEGIRGLHEQDPDRFSTDVLADQFKVSPEAVRRILRSKWSRQNPEVMDDRRARWARRHDRIWDHKAELGLRPPRTKDRVPEGPERFEEELMAKEMLGQLPK